MAALRELFVKLTTEADTEGIEEVEEATEGATAGLMKFAKVAGGIFAAGQIVSGFSNMADEADRLAKAAGTLDVGVERLQAWEGAAKRAGVDTAILADGFKQVQIRTKDAADGSQGMIDLFDDLGVSGAELARKSPDQQLLEVGNALNKIENPAKRNAIALKLLGGQGEHLTRIFTGGDEATVALLKKLELLAPISAEAAKEFEEFNDEVTAMKEGFFGIAVAIGTAILPPLKLLVSVTKSVVNWFRELNEGTALVPSLLIAIAVAITSAVVPAIVAFITANGALILSMLPWIAGILLAVLVLDELITTFQGGDTMIRRAIDGMFGEGSTATMVEFFSLLVTEPGKAFDMLVAGVANMISLFVEAFDFMTDDIAIWIAEMVKLFDDLWVALNESTGGFLNTVAKMFKKIGAAITQPFEVAFAKVKAIFAQIKATAASIASIIPGLGGSEPVAAGAGGEGGTSNNSASMSNTTNISIDGFGGSVSDLASAVGGAVGGVIDSASTGLGMMISEGR